ncbi:HAMP domain-containing sensor histidine kinase [Streptomyces sp. NPDC001985]|uniref:sensor histidine kinase n=1 Tax=Streptomyces sp. NPDC001985 TaxID=3154406 RepID=UPI00331710CC
MPGREPGPPGGPRREPRRRSRRGPGQERGRGSPRRLPLRRSLLGRLLAVSALVAACSVAATAWLAVQTTTGAIRQEQGQNLTDGARIYDALRGHAATSARWDGVQKTVRDLARKYDRRIALTTRDRRTIADSAGQGAGSGSGSGSGSSSGSGSGSGSGAPAPALPAQASAVVDPLNPHTALAPAAVPNGADPADRIDPRAVGPFRLPAAERATLRKTARGTVACLRDYALAADIVETPSGRPHIRIVGHNGGDVPAGTRCGENTLAEPTRTEARALTALNKLSDDCLKLKGRKGVRLNLDLSWKGGPPAPEKMPEPVVDGGGSAVRPLPAPPPSDGMLVLPRSKPGDSAADRDIASCVETARREQLTSHVSPPALLFIGDSDGPTVPGFDLSPENTARIVGVAALVLALTFGATLLAASRLVRPLRALTGAAQRMKDGERSEPVPVTTDNEIGRLAAAFNDMTAHRARMEAQRRAMVSDVAHELRTPLSNIRGWLEGAQDGIAEPDEAFVSSLLEEAVQLQHIIDDLQDLAEADAGALRLHPEPVGIAELVCQVAAAHQGRADTAGVTLRTVADEDLPVLRADPVRLRQAVGNLVSNAVRHTPPGGSVTLRAHRCGEGRLAVAVADTGEGIAADDLPYVFDRFWRAEKSRNRRTGGSGLGLAIVRKLVEGHGGSVDVESRAGHGAVFTLRLPVAGPPEEGARRGAGDGADTPTTTI